MKKGVRNTIKTAALVALVGVAFASQKARADILPPVVTITVYDGVDANPDREGIQTVINYNVVVAGSSADQLYLIQCLYHNFEKENIRISYVPEGTTVAYINEGVDGAPFDATFLFDCGLYDTNVNFGIEVDNDEFRDLNDFANWESMGLIATAKDHTQNFVQTLVPQGIPELIDTDLDGQKDWQEIIAGTNPTNSADYFTTSMSVTNGNIELTGNPSLEGRIYTGYEKGSLTNDVWTTVGSYTGSVGKVAIPVGLGKKFFKISVQFE